MRLALVLLSIVLLSNTSNAQSTCVCCTDDHKLFNFWIGDWNVYDSTGKLVGENTIVAQVDSCILREYWRGTAGSVGRSYNYFDRSDGTWNQLWIDKQGNSIKLNGTGEEGKMEMSSEFWEAGPGTEVQNRISWTLLENGEVNQRWDILDRSGTILQTLFNGYYRKKEQSE
jgi:hypothetical protein